MKDIYGKCGCNCGQCPAFEPNIKSDDDRKATARGWSRYFGINFRKHDWIICRGCQAPEPWKGGYQLPDRGCYIRPCVIFNEFKTCAYCSEFACEELVGRMPDETFRARIEKRLGERMPEKDYRLYVKPYEAIKNSRDLHEKLKPKDIAAIEAQTDESVRAAARASLQPGQMTWVIVGDLAQIEQPIRALSLGEVQVLDADGNRLR